MAVLALSACNVLQLPTQDVRAGPCRGQAGLDTGATLATTGVHARAPLITWGLTCGVPSAPTDVAPLVAARPADTFRFVHLSDAQVHERAYQWSEDLANEPGDWLYDERSIIKSVMYNDVGQPHYLRRLFTALKRSAERGDIAFVAHTGDAVHFNFPAEWAVYNKVLHRYLTGSAPSPWTKIPIEGSDAYFLNGLGNHDVLQLGVLEPGDPLTLLAFTPKMSLEAGRGLEDTVDFLRQTWSLPEGAHPFGADKTPYTTHDVTLPASFGPRRARIILLNTADIVVPCRNDFKGLNGGLGGTQTGWLRERLRDAERDESIALVLVMGHHTARSTRAPAVARCDNGTHVTEENGLSGPAGLGDLLAGYPKVAAYFSGHGHTPMAPARLGPGRRIAEFVTPGLVEYPKCATVVDVKAERDRGAGGVRITTRCVNLDDLDGYMPNDVVLARPRGEIGSAHSFFPRAYVAWRDALMRVPPRRRDRSLAATTLAGAATDWFLYRNEDARSGRTEPAGHHPMRWPRDLTWDCGDENRCLADADAVQGHVTTARAWWHSTRKRTNPNAGVFVPLAGILAADPVPE